MATVTGLYNDYWSLPRVKPNYQAQIESFDKIAAYKNQQYEKAYSYINQLKQTTLSMDFMKKEYKDKMDTYNTELNELFKNKDLRSVDLSESKIANTYVGWFDKVANDKELIGAFKYEGKIKSEYARIKAGAQNPKKSGYADANFVVWQNAQGGLNDYLENDVDETFFSQPTPTYTPFYDVWKDINTLMSMAQESKDGSSYQIPSKDGMSFTTITKKELREGKLETLFGLMDAQAINQLKINEKAQFYNTMGAIPKEQHGEYLEKIKGNVIKGKDTIYQGQLKSQSNYIAGKKKDIELLKQGGNFQEASTQEELLRRMEQEHARYEVEGKPDIDELTGLGKHDIAELYSAYNVQLQLKGFAAAFASSDVKVVESPNETYWLNQDYNFEREQFEWDKEMDLMNYQAKMMTASGKTASTAFVDPNGIPFISGTLGEGDVSEVGEGTPTRAAYETAWNEIKSLENVITGLEFDGNETDIDTTDDIITTFLNIPTKDYTSDIVSQSSVAKLINTAIKNLNLRGTVGNLTALSSDQKEKLKAEVISLSNSSEFKKAAQNDLKLFKLAKNSLGSLMIDAAEAAKNSWNRIHPDNQIIQKKRPDGKKYYYANEKGEVPEGYVQAYHGEIGGRFKAFMQPSMMVQTKKYGGDETVMGKIASRVNQVSKEKTFTSDMVEEDVYYMNGKIRLIPKALPEKVTKTVTIGDKVYTWGGGTVTVDNKTTAYIEIPYNNEKDEYVKLLNIIFSKNRVIEGLTSKAGDVYNISQEEDGTYKIHKGENTALLPNISAVAEFFRTTINK